MKDLHLQRLKTPSLLASGNPGAFLISGNGWGQRKSLRIIPRLSSHWKLKTKLLNQRADKDPAIDIVMKD